MVARNKMVFLGLKNKFGMKQFKILCMKSLILLLAIVSISCGNVSKPIKRFNNAKEMKIYKIAEIPTVLEEHLSGKDYIMDYEVIEEINTSLSERKNLRQAIVNTQNYTNDNNKKCIFFAQYAIKLDEFNTIIVSMNPCGKIIVSGKKSENPIRYDLVNGNQIEAMIYSIIK